ncbi:MAG: hypothetical protein M1839_001105 [Geoglossum umbratile]|nr:MAG: hypothetical protein M1839_001105 [Geoglossum umbratile]
MDDEIDYSQIDWSQLLDLEGGDPCFNAPIHPKFNFADEAGCMNPNGGLQGHVAASASSCTLRDPSLSYWPDISHSGNNYLSGLLASPSEVHSVLQLPKRHDIRSSGAELPCGVQVVSEADWMGNHDTGLWDRVELSDNQLQPTVPELGVPEAHCSSRIPPYPSSTLSAHGMRQLQGVSVDTADDFKFVSGCRPIGAATTASARGYETTDPDALICVWPNCSSKRTFKRIYELQRHMKKHGGPVKYPCTAVDCPSKRAAVFYRLDKFRDHLRNTHNPDDLFTCPDPACTIEPLPLFISVIHAHSHNSNAFGKREGWHWALKAFQVFDYSASKRPCPLEGCRKWLPHTSVPAHLRSHEIGDLIGRETDIAEAGYDISSGCTICPVCRQTSASPEIFAEHLVLHHLTVDVEHFAAWREACRPFITYKMLPWGRLHPWEHPPREGLVCPMCGLQGAAGQSYFPEFTHQRNFLAPFDWIDKDLQNKILNLWPDFKTHPVFDSIRAPVARMRS